MVKTNEQQRQFDQVCNAMVTTMVEEDFARVTSGIASGSDCKFIFGIYGRGIVVLKVKEPWATEYRRVIFQDVQDELIKEWEKERTFRW